MKKIDKKEELQYRDVTAQLPKFKSLNNIVNIPEPFLLGSLELKQGVSFRLGKRRVVTIVPPQDALRDDKFNLSALFEKPSSWLLVIEDDFGQLNGRELEITPSSKKGTVVIRLLRNSGYLVAEGAATLEGMDALTFEVKMRSKGNSKNSGRTQSVFSGSLNAGKEWRLKAML